MDYFCYHARSNWYPCGTASLSYNLEHWGNHFPFNLYITSDGFVLRAVALLRLFLSLSIWGKTS